MPKLNTIACRYQARGRVLSTLLCSALSASACTNNDASPDHGGGLGSETRVITVALVSDLPRCTPTLRSTVYYATVQDAFFYCNGSQHVEIEVVGAPGADGTSWLVSFGVAGGAECPAGGVLLHLGPDTDGNGELAADEIVATEAVCNGVDGAEGSPGEPGAPGQNGQDGKEALITTEPAPAATCPTGGISVFTGLDDNGDGLLSADEVENTDYVCNGQAGPAGNDGADGADGLTALVDQVLELAGANCAQGGTRIDTGLDDDRNGTLDPAEVDDTTYVCHGEAEPVSESVAVMIDDTLSLSVEGGSSVFTVRLIDEATGAPAVSEQTITVNYFTADYSAEAFGDYAPNNGRLVFAPGMSSHEVHVQTLDDSFQEQDESFSVILTDATNALLSDSQGFGVIVDNDSAPTPMISIASASGVEGNTGSTNLVFQLALSAPSATSVAVNFATADGSATAGTDYTAVSGTVVFPAGTVTQAIFVQVLGDVDVEGNETFSVSLSSSVNAVITEGIATGTIIDLD